MESDSMCSLYPDAGITGGSRMMRQWVDKWPGGWIKRWRDPLMDEVGERKPARPSGFWVRSQPGHGVRHRAGKRGWDSQGRLDTPCPRQSDKDL